MKSNLSTKEIQEALARLEKAKAERTNAQRRLSRAKDAVDKATKEVAENEEEFKAASNHLDQAVRRGIAAAMKKGGSDTSVKLAEIIAQSLGGTTQEDEDPAPAPAASPQKTGEAVERKEAAAPAVPENHASQTADADDSSDADDASEDGDGADGDAGMVPVAAAGAQSDLLNDAA
jgi:hypothetical protein